MVKPMSLYNNLFLISGRDSNLEDDDSVFIVEAENIGSANDMFTSKFESKKSNVEIFTSTPLADAISERLVASYFVRNERVSPLLSMYVISGRVIGEDEDSVCIVEANDANAAEATFEQHLRAEHEGVPFEDADNDIEIINVCSKHLIDAVNQKLFDPSKESHFDSPGIG